MTKFAEIIGSKLIISDATLRDGSHPIRHTLTPNQVSEYCTQVDKSGVNWIEVGHGNGLGASSFHIGKSTSADFELLMAARKSINNAKLSIHAMPGIATLRRDIIPAIEVGVDIFRFGSHCTEADTTARYISEIASREKTAVGVLMMCHMSSASVLLEQAKIMENAGASAVMVMDSAGAMELEEVELKIRTLVEGLSIPVGIHAHNNLGLAVANSMVAVAAGAIIVDACAGGLGAGAGNAAIEILIPIFNRRGLCTVDEITYFRAVEMALTSFMPNLQTTSPTSVATGMAGLFSGFLQPILTASDANNVDKFKLIAELGKLTLVAGQEDVVIETALNLRNSTITSATI
ncbi:LeuA Isopropylmalate/homocitrate/citramalate synthases [Candidatus Nanopelagicaceae bacterium]